MLNNNFSYYHFISLTKKYLQSNSSRRVQFWPHCTISFDIVLLTKKQHSNSVEEKNRKLLINN